MSRLRTLVVAVAAVSAAVGSLLVAAEPAVQGDQPMRQALMQTMQQGNYGDAYQGLRKLALDPAADPAKVSEDLKNAVQCLQQLGRVDEIDAFREAVVDAHPKNWRLLRAAAQTFMDVQHQGFIVAGEFQRGPHRGGGQPANVWQRDRVRALQLMTQALPLVKEDNDHAAGGQFFLQFAQMLLNNRGFHEAWRLQDLTDLSTLPDYELGWYRADPTSGAPVDADNRPVFHELPRSFEAAQTDGQRWRWCLDAAREFDASLADEVRLHFADFLHNQFGVQTMAEYGLFFGRMAEEKQEGDATGTFELHTLPEDETIARLATGIRRFELPEEFNFIHIYQEVGREGKSVETKLRALGSLAGIFENRRQYSKAADCWRQCVALRSEPQYRNALAQIVGNWGRFDPVMSQPAGAGATIDYVFRNGKSVEFTAREVKVEQLLSDVKAYLRGNPKELDWRRLNIDDLGHRLIHQRQEKYLGAEVARWTLPLEPRPEHFDRRITVTTPLQKAGAYLLTAKMAQGNTSHVVVWLSDLAIAQKPLDGKTLYYVADAAGGSPVARARMELFGYRQEFRNATPPRHEVLVKESVLATGDDGQLITTPQNQPQDYNWIVTARTPEGRFGYLGFSNVWYAQRYDAEYNEVKVFPITDRPVYRPGQKVQYKFWVRHAKYDQPDTSDFAGQEFQVEIHNPKGETVEKKTFQADAYGGFAGELTLPDDATLGVWQMVVVDRGTGQFRVEEYKKPEYEVTVDAPAEPVMLGEKIEATIRAKYYFGSPVTKARVKYKVERTSHDARWYPPMPWDWLYGPGYWWFAYDYTWYRGWSQWGTSRPTPVWWPGFGFQPPELVADREVEIGPDGTVKVEIDTAVAQAVHPDQDHRYQITAEVVDESRRTIVGTGEVLVARKPFQVTAWVDRGYYRAGDTLHAHFAARRLDGQPVQGEGKLVLLRISYQDGEPVETPVEEWKLPTGEDGRAEQQLQAARPGQYRLSYTVTDAKGHAIEGGYLFTVTGQGFDGADYRFDAVELIPEKAEYAPGEKIKLQVNADRAGGTVLLFVRPANGVYLPPEVIRLEGKSTLREIEVTQRDMPNFFLEAVTIAGGRVHSTVREITVPPEKRILNVEVAPSAETYRPGEKAKVQVKLTDLAGRPFVGSTVLAIYDKSLEYISGGSNVPEIKAFFWQWRRSHHPQTTANLERWFHNIAPPNEQGMGFLGAFGATVASEMEELQDDKSGRALGFGGMGGSDRGVMLRKGNAMARRGAIMQAPGAPEAAAPAMMELAVASDAAAPAEANFSTEGSEKQGGQQAAQFVEPTVRTNFADTALWAAALTTADDGTAEVSLDMPENLTTWRIKVWGMGQGTKVGEGFADVVTRKDLILRMQAPRFFVQTDEVVLSANVHNYLKSAKNVRVELEVEGGVLQPLDELARSAEIAPEDEARIDWRVRVAEEGEAVVRMKALTDEESDAMEMRFPAYIHGMLKTVSYSGVVRPEQQGGKFDLEVPAQRRPQQSRIEVRWSPTLAGAMVDALPYLVDFPYGCTEQTLNRFLPTVITQKVLIGMGIDLKALRDKQVNLNPQEIGDAQERAGQWKRYDRNPVFDQEEVARMVRDGVERLAAMQQDDGGWGWFSGRAERSSPHMTALVVHGLLVARHNDVALPEGMLPRGVEWLAKHQAEEVRKLDNAKLDPKKHPWKTSADNMDAYVYLVLVEAGADNAAMREYLYRDRLNLSVLCLAQFGLALEEVNDREKLAMVLRNIGQYVVEDDENQSAWLRLPEGIWWYWYGSDIEAQAYYLKLLSRTDPKGRLASRLVKYLLNNRKNATWWNSTRDTSLCVEAMAEYLRASGEAKPEMTVEVFYDGQRQKAVEITPATLFSFDNQFVLQGEAVEAGRHQVELRRQGEGPLYFNGYVTNFTLEDFITAAGLEIKVERHYYRLTKKEKTEKVPGSRGQVVDQQVEAYQREELPNLATVASGDLVEVELVIESKNDYEYVVFEDMKPAGFEPVEVRSGYNGNAMGAYVEYRDERVAMFVARLARGRHSLSYRTRAEIPGRFSALPTRAWAMYAPELRANSDEIKLKVEDR